MIYLHKILPVPALPIGLTVLFISLGLFLRRRTLCLAGIGILWLSSSPLVGDLAMRTAEGWQIRRAVDDVPQAQAIVVLSNAPVIPPGDATTVEWDDAVDRFDAGMALYRARKAPVLIFTGGRLPWRLEDRPSGEVLAEQAIAQGVPRERILVTDRAANTAAEAQTVAELLQRTHIPTGGPVIVVTSAFHMRRAQLLFERAGMDVIPFPVDFRVPEGHVFTILDLLPSAAALERTEMALRELYGYLYYACIQMVAHRTLALPFHNNLSAAQIEAVVAALQQAVTAVG